MNLNLDRINSGHSNGVNFESTPKLMMFSRGLRKLDLARSHESGNWSEGVLESRDVILE